MSHRLGRLAGPSEVVDTSWAAETPAPPLMSPWRLQMSPSLRLLPLTNQDRREATVPLPRSLHLSRTQQYISWDNYCDWVQMRQVSAARIRGGGGAGAGVAGPAGGSSRAQEDPPLLQP